jgi:hypothetical protein
VCCVCVCSSIVGVVAGYIAQVIIQVLNSLPIVCILYKAFCVAEPGAAASFWRIGNSSKSSFTDCKNEQFSFKDGHYKDNAYMVNFRCSFILDP